MKTKKIILTTILILGTFFALNNNLVLADYTPLEPIPGTAEGDQTTFPGYVNAIYKFAIWSVGIAAFLMISIGGFTYITAAGNNSRMETAKKIISDALFGLVAVMVAWLILNKINPDLVNIDLNSITNLGS
jgi:type IV secretion system pilin